MKMYNNLQIKNKLILGFLVLSIISALVGGFGMLTIAQIKASADKMYRENAMALQYAGSAAMRTQAIVSSAQTLSKMDMTKEKDAILTGSERISRDMANVDSILESLGSVVNNDIRSSSLDDILSNWGSLKMYLNSVVSSVQGDNGAGMAESAIRLSTNFANNVTNSYTTLFGQVSGEANTRAAENNNQATTAMIVMGSVLVTAIVLSIILAYSLAKSIGYPLKLMAAVGMRIADGDVNVDDIMTEKGRGLADRKDEIGILASMVNRLIIGAKEQAHGAQLVADGDLTVEINLKSDRDLLGLSLRELVDNFHNMAKSITQAAQKVALSSDAVSNSSVVLSQGATEQACAIEQLNVTIDSITRQTELNAENASRANGLAQNVKENAEIGNRQMKEMLSAMQEISESSKNISKVIKVIDDIAFQTNILALNAAVEAARAGQAGKGFAVVAQEVRALAVRSANAVRDTTDMIESSIRKVAAGTSIANHTADALNEILTEVEKSAELVSAINVASKEQELGIQQVELGIAQVSQVVQTNAATAEESAAASEEMLRQASELKDYVNVFKLRDSMGMFEMPVNDTRRADGQEIGPGGYYEAEDRIDGLPAELRKY